MSDTKKIVFFGPYNILIILKGNYLKVKTSY